MEELGGTRRNSEELGGTRSRVAQRYMNSKSASNFEKQALSLKAINNWLRNWNTSEMICRLFLKTTIKISAYLLFFFRSGTFLQQKLPPCIMRMALAKKQISKGFHTTDSTFDSDLWWSTSSSVAPSPTAVGGMMTEVSC